MYSSPIRGSDVMPTQVSSTSVSNSSATDAISLAKDSLSARNAFAPFFHTSAAATSMTRTGAPSRPAEQCREPLDHGRVGVGEPSDDDTAGSGGSRGKRRALAQEFGVGQDAAGRDAGCLDRGVRVAPGGRVLRTTSGTSSARRPWSCSRGATSFLSCDRSLRPSAPIGVPTQTMTASASASAGRSAMRSWPDSSPARSASGRPSSWIGGSSGAEDREAVRPVLDELDAVPELDQAHGRDEPDVPGADDRELPARCLVHGPSVAARGSCRAGRISVGSGAVGWHRARTEILGDPCSDFRRFER